MTASEVVIILTSIIIPVGLSVYVIIKAIKGIERPIQKQAAITIGILQGVFNLARALLYIDKINNWKISDFLFIFLSIGTIFFVIFLDKIVKNFIRKYYEKN